MAHAQSSLPDSPGETVVDRIRLSRVPRVISGMTRRATSGALLVGASRPLALPPAGRQYLRGC